MSSEIFIRKIILKDPPKYSPDHQVGHIFMYNKVAVMISVGWPLPREMTGFIKSLKSSKAGYKIVPGEQDALFHVNCTSGSNCFIGDWGWGSGRIPPWGSVCVLAAW